MFKVNVFTVDGDQVIENFVHHSVDEWASFQEFVATYIDTEGQVAFSGGYVVQLIDHDGILVAEETQESYIL